MGGKPRDVIAPETLDRMTDAMTHRGPDERGVYLAPSIAIGVRRLSIVDVAHGHQPVFNEDSSVVAAQNGELYNHTDVRKKLRGTGHTLSTACDTEVIPHLYEDDGPGFPEHLSGKFAIVVWDANRRTAVLARDRLGVKPLYWARIGDLVVFGSELKAVLASGLVDTEISVDAVAALFCLGYVPGPLTILRHVRKLAPGSTLTVTEAGISERRFWSFPHPATAPAETSESTERDLLQELEQAVSDRLMADVPLGLMLSGGVDSALILALMSRHVTTPIETFSVGFREDRESNELLAARRTAAYFRTRHHEAELSVQDLEDLDTLLWYLDEPVADVSAVGFLALSQIASQRVKVALSGQGADELFGGYRKHRAAALARDLRAFPSPVTKLVAAGARRTKIARVGATLLAPDPFSRVLAMSRQLSEREASSFVGSRFEAPIDSLVLAAMREGREEVDADPVAETLFLDAQLGLVDHMLHYFDRMSMGASLEVRVPFLDHRVVELAARVPTRLKVNLFATKILLRSAAADVLPGEILKRPKIGFFRRTAEIWLRAQLSGTRRDQLLDGQVIEQGFVNRSAMIALLAEHSRGASSHTQLLLSVLLLEHWLGSYLKRAVG